MTPRTTRSRAPARSGVCTLASKLSPLLLLPLLLPLLGPGRLLSCAQAQASARDQEEDARAAMAYEDSPDSLARFVEGLQLLQANLAARSLGSLGLRASSLGSRTAWLTDGAADGAGGGQLRRGRPTSPVGLRRIQRRPELSELTTALKRSPNVGVVSGLNPAAASGPPKQQHKFLYVIAPVSEQVLPVQSEKLAQGFTSLLSLPGGNYETGLRKWAEVAPSGATWPLAIATAAASKLGGCRAIKTSVQLARDELEPASGRLVRRCSGRVQLTACEGSCNSSSEPSIRSPSGFIKKCACCNEGAFRRLQVRLSNCYLPAEGPADQMQVGDSVQPISGFMDVEVEEPMECKCRPCDNLP